jgi:hypothetical protein
VLALPSFDSGIAQTCLAFTTTARAGARSMADRRYASITALLPQEEPLQGELRIRHLPPQRLKECVQGVRRRIDMRGACASSASCQQSATISAQRKHARSVYSLRLLFLVAICDPTHFLHAFFARLLWQIADKKHCLHKLLA